MHQTCDIVTRCEDAVFAPLGISGQQYVVLIHLAYSEKPITLTALSRKLRRNMNSTSAIVERMSTRGLVRRQKVEAGGRATSVALTPKGKRTAEEAAQYGWDLIKRLSVNSSPTQLRSCVKLMAGIRTEAAKMLKEASETRRPS